MKLLLPLLITTLLSAEYTRPMPKSSDNTYKSSQNNRYQYDLSNQSDKLRYSTDTAAQQRDYRNSLYNPTYNQYDTYGEKGAGIYR